VPFLPHCRSQDHHCGSETIETLAAANVTLDEAETPPGEVLIDEDLAAAGPGHFRQATFAIDPSVLTEESDVRIRFAFDSGDSISNDFEGWYLHDFEMAAFLTLGNLADVVRLDGMTAENAGARAAGVGNVAGDDRSDLAVLLPGSNEVRIIEGSVQSLSAFLTSGAALTSVGSSFDVTALGLPAFNLSPESPFAQVTLRGTGNAEGTAGVFDDWMLSTSTATFLQGDADAILTTALTDLGALIPVGDVDGDGIADLAAPALEEAAALDETTRSHRVFHVFLGSDTALAPAPAALAERFAQADLVIEPGVGVTTLDKAGLLIASAGNVDGPGDLFGDLLVADGPGGNAYLLRGAEFGDSTLGFKGSAGPPTEHFEFALATAGSASGGTSGPPGLSFSDEDPDLAQGFALEGAAIQEQLSTLFEIGDFNRDGQTDFLATSQSGDKTYLFFGPMALDSVERVADRADIVFDSDPITGNAVFAGEASAAGDVDGDGSADLVFSSGSSATLVFGGKSVRREPVLGDPDLGDLYSVTIQLPGVADFLGGLDWDGDSTPDTLPGGVPARIPQADLAFLLPQVAANGTAAYIVTGAQVLAAMDPDKSIPATSIETADWQITLSDLENTPLVGSVVGDFDGDGFQDLAIGPQDGNVSIIRGRADTPGVISTPDFTITGAGPDQIFRLGDVNNDGYADIGLARNIESKTSGASIHIVFGSNVDGGGAATLDVGDATALEAIRIRQLALESLGTLDTVNSSISLSAGDLDGDDEADLLVGLSKTTRTIAGTETVLDGGRVFFFADIADGVRTDLVLGDPNVGLTSDANAILDGEALGDQLGSLSATPFLDLDGDGVDDLVVGAANADISSPSLLDKAGRIYAVYGSPSRLTPPGSSQWELIANRTITGSGDFLVDRGTGKPDVFADAGGSTTFTLEPGNRSQLWFKFSTLADGEADDFIRLSPGAGSGLLRLRAPSTGTLAPDGSGGFVIPAGNPDEVRIGGSDAEAGIFEFDIAVLLSEFGETSILKNAEIVLDASVFLGGTAPNDQTLIDGVLYYAAPDGTGEGGLWRSDGTLPGSRELAELDASQLTAVGTDLYFVADEGSGSGVQVYRMDTAASTPTPTAVSDLSLSYSNPTALVRIDDAGTPKLVFAALDDSTALWSLYTVSGTTLQILGQIGDGFTSPSLAVALAATETDLYARVESGTGFALFRNAGFSAGAATAVVGGDFSSGFLPTVPFETLSDGSTLYFTATTSGVTPTEGLYRIAGSSASVESIDQGAAAIDDLVLVDAGAQRLVWYIRDAGGTVASTTLHGFDVTSPVPAPGTGAFETVSGLRVRGTELFFVASGDGATFGDELHRIVGTTFSDNGFTFITDINRAGDSALSEPVLINGELFFFATDSQGQRGLWRSDGSLPDQSGVIGDRPTLSGAQTLIAELDAPSDLVGAFVGGAPRLYFEEGGQRWASDGTPSGTLPVGQIGTLSTELMVSILDREGDAVVTSDDGSETAIDTILFSGVSLAGGGPLRLSGAALTNAIETALKEGRTRITLRIESDASAAPLHVNTATSGGLQPANAETSLELDLGPGVVADLLGADGELLARGLPLVSLRGLAAGDYFLRVYVPDSNALVTPGELGVELGISEPIPFAISVAAPLQGAPTGPNEPSRRDVIRGGDGDDILIGNEQQDRLFGESGRDLFVAEDFEVRDRESNERPPLVPPASEATISSQPPPKDVGVHFADLKLERILAGLLGVPITEDGVVARRIMASEMATLTRLDLSGESVEFLGGVSLDEALNEGPGGLGYAINLETLDLSGNAALSNLQALRPDKLGFEAVGGLQLETLILDGTMVSDLTPLEGMARLEQLSADRAPIVDLEPLRLLRELEFLSVDSALAAGGGVVDLAPLRSLSALRVLSLSGNRIEVVPMALASGWDALEYLYLHDNRLRDIAGLGGQLVIDDSDVEFATSLGDRNLSPVSEAYQDQYVFFMPDGVGGQSIASFGGQPDEAALLASRGLLSTGVYEIFVTWPHDQAGDDDFSYRAGAQQYDVWQHILEDEGLASSLATGTQAPLQPRFAPAPGASFDGQEWQSLGTFALARSDAEPGFGGLEVRLLNDADGYVLADAVRIVPVGAPLLPSLQRVTLDDNELNELSYAAILPALGFPKVDFDLNPAAPSWTQDPGDAVIDTGVTSIDISLFANDADGAFFSARTLDLPRDPAAGYGATLEIAGDLLTVTAEPGFHGTVRILVTASDSAKDPAEPAGRETSRFVDVHIDTGVISGAVFVDDDAAEQRIEGRIVELRSEGATLLSTVTDANGEYRFTGDGTTALVPGIYNVVELLPSAWVQTTPPEFQNAGFEDLLAEPWGFVGDVAPRGEDLDVDAISETHVVPTEGNYQIYLRSAATTTGVDVATLSASLGLSADAIENAMDARANSQFGGISGFEGSDTFEVTGGSALQREIEVPEGAELQFDWNFLAGENSNGFPTSGFIYFPDFAFLSVKEIGGDFETVVFLADTADAGQAEPTDVGSDVFRGQTGYQPGTTFSFPTPDDLGRAPTGRYVLGFGVADAWSTGGTGGSNSALLVDNLSISGVTVPDGLFEQITGSTPLENRDFGVLRIVDAGEDRSGPEGGLVTLDATVAPEASFVGAPEFLWTIDPGALPAPEVVSDLTSSQLQFRPLENGEYKLSVSVTDGAGGVREFVDTVSFFATNVQPGTTGLVATGALEETDGPDTIQLSLSDLVWAPGANGNGDVSLVWSVDLDDDGIFDLVDVATDANGLSLPALGNDGEISVRFAIIDGDGESFPETGFGTGLVSISNRPPVLALDDPGALTEGNSFELTGTVSDVLADSLSVTVDFGDGTVQTISLPPGGGLFAVPHTYLEDGGGAPFAITVTASDEDGGSAFEVLPNVLVENAPPVIGASGQTFSGVEGSPVAFDAAVSDVPGDLGDLLIEWDFEGDHLGNPSFVTQATGMIVSHLFPGDAETYTVRLRVSDGDGAVVSTTLTAEVANLAPVIDPIAKLRDVSVISGIEGQEVVFSAAGVDPGGDPLTYAWDFDDDGTIDAMGAETSWVFPNEGSFLARLVVSDDAPVPKQTVAFVPVEISNAGPTVVIDPPGLLSEGVAGSAIFSLTGEIGDVLADRAELVATIDFGDGSPVQPLALSPLDGRFSIEHEYGDDGIYSIQVEARDADGAVTIDARTVAVANSAPSLVVNEPGLIDAVGPVVVLSGQVLDVPGDSLRLQADFGDGSRRTIGIGSDGFFSISHGYADHGEFTVRLSASDQDGGVTEIERLATVAPPTPQSVQSALGASAGVSRYSAYLDVDGNGTINIFDVVLAAGLDAREVTVLRAYCKFLRQARIPFSQRYMERTLARHPELTCRIVRLFQARFAPATPCSSEARRSSGAGARSGGGWARAWACRAGSQACSTRVSRRR